MKRIVKVSSKLLLASLAFSPMAKCQSADLRSYLARPSNQILLGDEFIVRGLLDPLTTELAHNNKCRCFHEAELPKFIAYNPALMYSYSLSVMTAVDLASYKLDRRGHHRLAKWVLLSDVIAESVTVAHNYYELRRWGR